VEQLTKVVRTLGAEGDEEVRTLVVRTLVVEGAQAAGLSCAQPLSERSQASVLVYGAADGPRAALRARVVSLQGVGLEDGPAALAPDLKPGELLALLDWSEEEDALYLLTDAQVRETWSDPQLPGGWDTKEWTFGGWCRATPKRWRELVTGRSS
jgi:hypothetical protein